MCYQIYCTTVPVTCSFCVVFDTRLSLSPGNMQQQRRRTAGRPAAE